MTARDISQARDPLLRASFAAMQRAAAMARETAIRTNTGIIVVRDGKVVRISAQALRRTAVQRLAEPPIPGTDT